MKMKYYFKLLFIVSIVLISSYFTIITASSAPLHNLPQLYTQPDGEVIELFVSGDEFFSYIHDENGNIIIKNLENDYYVYADFIDNKIIPTNQTVSQHTLNTFTNQNMHITIEDIPVDIAKEQNCFSSGITREEQEDIVKLSERLNWVGTEVNQIVIFIDFEDLKFGESGAGTGNIEKDFDSVFNNPNDQSLKSYIKEVSYNQQNVNSYFFHYRESDYPRDYYNTDNHKEGQYLLDRALQAVKEDIENLNVNLNVNGDKDVDLVSFVISGNATPGTFLWPHLYGFLGPGNVPLTYIDGDRIDCYTIQLEAPLLGIRGSGVHYGYAVLAHESLHMFGFPDLYSSFTTVGDWDIMCYGSGHTSAYSKSTYGQWFNMPEITQSGLYKINNIIYKDNNSYIIRSPLSDDEYFVVEYRNNSGSFDSALLKGGFVIYRAKESLKYRGNTSAASQDDLEIVHLWDGTSGSYELNFSDGSSSGIKLYNISATGDAASFEISLDESESENTNFNAALGIIPTFNGDVRKETYATDGYLGDIYSEDYTDLGYNGPQWMQIDLGNIHKIEGINIWRYTGMKYKDLVYQVSNDPTFETGVTTVYNNDADNSLGLGKGSDFEYVETPAGQSLRIGPVNARYIRLWSNGNNANPYCHYREVEVMSSGIVKNAALDIIPTFNGNARRATYATDGRLGDIYSEDYTDLGYNGPQWMQIDLGSIHKIEGINIWRYTGMKYKDLVYQVSNDPTFETGVTTVFNNDTDNSLGLGKGSDAEYTEIPHGQHLICKPVNARYIRLWSNGNNANPYCHYREVEVMSSGIVKNAALDIIPTFNGNARRATYATDGYLGEIYSEDYTDLGYNGPQWMQIDLGDIHKIEGINTWRYTGMKYKDLVYQVSNDPTFETGVTTVFNNDADNSLGLGKGSDADYTEIPNGQHLICKPVNARYIRLWSNGNNANPYCHYREVEVMCAIPHQ